MTDVLVLRALGLGDALTGVAALRGVRRAWPGARVVLAGPAGLGAWLRARGVVDDVLPVDGLDLAAVGPLAWDGRGHVAVNLHGRGPQSHRLLAATRPDRLVAFGCADAGHEGPAWDEAEHEVVRWCRLVADAGGPCGPADLRLPALPTTDGGAGGGTVVPGDHIVLHPGAASGSRRWPVERWSAVARALVAAGHPVVLTGGAAEAPLTAAIAAAGAGHPSQGSAPGITDLAGALDLDGLAATVGAARLLVCGDTGVAHLATALGTASVLLFGPVSPARWGPALDPGRHLVLWHGDGSGDPHADVLDPALARVTVAEVLAAAGRALAGQATV